MELDPRQSYAAKVIVGLLVVLLVGGTAGAYTYVSTSEQVRESQRNTLGSQADVQDDVLDTILRDQVRNTRHVAESIREIQKSTVTTERTRRNVRSYLSESANSSDAIVRFSYVEANTSLVLASSRPAYESERLTQIGFDVPESIESGEVGITFRQTLGEESWVVFVPISENRWLVGEISVRYLTEELDTVMDGTNTRVVNDEGIVVLDARNVSAVGTQHVGGSGPDSPAVKAALAGGENTTVVSAAKSGSGQRVVAGYDSIDATNWAVVSYAPPNTLFAIANSVGKNILVLLGLVGVLLFGFSFVVERPTATALSDLSTHAEDLRRGNLDTEIETDRADDVGDLYRAFDRMRADLRERIAEAEQARSEAEQAQQEAERQREEAEAARQEAQAVNDHLETKAAEYEAAMTAAADGDLTVRVDPESDHEVVTSMGRNLNEVLAELEATVAEVESFAHDVVASSEQLNATAVEIRDASQQVSESVGSIDQRTHDQRERLQEVASETNDLSATIEEVASTADSVADTASRTASEAESGREAAEQAVEAIERVETTASTAVEEVDELVDHIHEVGDIVDVISDIAEQTNLLALNANIEAGRSAAGSDGFEVVAEEVKELAEQTQNHADDIEEHIDQIQDQTETTAERMREAQSQLGDGSETVETARDALLAVADRVEETDAGMQDINAATDEQASTTEQVAAMVDEVVDAAERTADETEQVSASAQQQTMALDEAADVVDELRSRADHLETAVEQFEVEAGADDATADSDGESVDTEDGESADAEDSESADAEDGESADAEDGESADAAENPTPTDD